MPAVRISSTDYLRLVEGWIKSAEKDIYTCPGREDLACYGPGYSGWGVQTHQKALAAYAVAAAHPDTDESSAGMSREALLERALKMLRFTLESHIEGSYRCTDGESWGRTWISTLGIERMMHGVEAVWKFLTVPDIELLKKVFISESDWLMDSYFRGKETSVPGEITAGEVENNNPENNIWSGAFLHRTAMLFPDAPRAREYREKGDAFLVNGISVPSDAKSDEVISGKTVAGMYKGANFFETYALNHHSYLNIGYMVICLSNLAMLYFSFKKRDIPPPEALLHHAVDLWKLVRLFTFPDGRLMRIGGDTRVRYCYCQDYCVPVWLMAQELFKDSGALDFELGWLRTVAREQEFNGDGSFLSSRCRNLGRISPLYYTRLESDRAAALSMGADWRRAFSFLNAMEPPGVSVNYSGSWHDPYHGAYFERGTDRIASWTWRAAEPPQGLCIPPGDSSLAEWRQNLAGEITGTGRNNVRKVLSHRGAVFKGGFLTWGKTSLRSGDMVAEGQCSEDEFFQETAFAALPDGASVLVIQRAFAGEKRMYARSVKGIFLNVPNDIFKGLEREYFYSGGNMRLRGVPGKEEKIDLGSPWVNIDNRISVISLPGSGPITIYRPADRQIGIKRFPARDNPLPGGMLYADEICCPCETGVKSFDPGETIYETAFLARMGMSGGEASGYAEGEGNVFVPDAPGGVSSSACRGADGYLYMLFLNTGAEGKNISMGLMEPAENLAAGGGIKSGGSFYLEGGRAGLLRFGM